MTEAALCGIVPTYDNPRTVRDVVVRLGMYVDRVIVVDDGSGPEGRDAAAALARDGIADVVRRDVNGGKGAAVKAGLERARALGYAHALQVDADGQHELTDAPALIAASRREPRALVLGAPIFDTSAPRARLVGRRITVFWSRVEAGSDAIVDPMCGFRVYPVDATLAAGARGDRMDFDPEIAVRLVWAGVPVVNVPTRVRYVPREEGGVSHFRMVRDNVRISLMHTRLVLLAWLGLFGAGPAARRRRLGP